MKVHKTKSLGLTDIRKALFDLYPETSMSFDISLSEKLFSPYHIQLPQLYLDKITNFNKSLNKIYEFRINELKNKNYNFKNKSFNNFNFENFETHSGILSCLDFHIDINTEEIKLIEANTNASGYLVGSLIYKINQLNYSELDEKLFFMFEKSQVSTKDYFFITDEQPEKQKMYLEFLLYKEFFKKRDKTLQIIDINELNQSIDNLKNNNKDIGVYNRSTDFYLSSYTNLLKLFLEGKISINPNPVLYDLFANKENLEDWANLENSKHYANLVLNNEEKKYLKNFLLKSSPIQTLFKNLDEAWAHRKKYFFKPSDSYGGKATYKGSSISRRYLENAWNENCLAQEYFPATKFVDEDKIEWKFDVRVYTYENEILYSLARVYQGQTTNFSTKGGGFAPVTFY